MIRVPFLYILFLIFLFSCDNKTETKSHLSNAGTNLSDTRHEAVSFFPLTNFIQGQLNEIKKSFVTPLKFDFKENRKDSTWLKSEELDTAFYELLNPSIDSAGMSEYFKESSFMDETLHLVTLTYDPVKTLPSNINWQHWDIYINPENNKISRIYMVKAMPNNHKLQITFIPGKSCRFITLNDKAKDLNSAKVSDVLIKWDL